MNLPLIIVFVYVFTRLFYLLTIKKCESKKTMVGKVVIVTGANSGIGFETASELASRGARVILACRSESRGTAARDKIVLETGNENVVYKHLDLSSLASVKSFASHIEQTEKHVHVLINNAGIFGFSDTFTKDEIVQSNQINYFAPFLLTLLLLPLLKKSKPSRIINLCSLVYIFGKIDLVHINEKAYNGTVSSYFNSNFYTFSTTMELSRRLAGSGVVVNAVHPGFVATNIARHTNFVVKTLGEIGCLLVGKSVNQGAQSVVHLAVAEECVAETGGFYTDCAERYILRAPDAATSKLLWQYSQNLVGFEGDI